MGAYRLDPAVRLIWASWEDEHVVFDETSGQTHQLDTLRAFILNAVSDAPQSLNSLCDQMKGAMPFADETKILAAIDAVLHEFETLGLVERVSL